MENKIEGGATIWARKTIDSVIFYDKPDKWFKIWFFLVNRVNHKKNRRWERGQCFTTYSEIALATKATKNQIDMCFRFLKKEQMLTTQKTTRGMTITIVNYSIYQDLKSYKNDTENDLGTKHKRNTNDTINKNDKNDNNEKNEEIISASGRLEEKIPLCIKIGLPKEKWSVLIDPFEKVNPVFKKIYQIIPERNALAEMCNEFGFEKTVDYISLMVDHSGAPYGPVITKPTELLRNLGKLIVFDKKESQKNNNKHGNSLQATPGKYAGIGESIKID